VRGDDEIIAARIIIGQPLTVAVEEHSFQFSQPHRHQREDTVPPILPSLPSVPDLDLSVFCPDQRRCRPRNFAVCEGTHQSTSLETDQQSVY
jgi:hypothetical protein